MGVGAGLYMYDVVVKMFTFAISSTDEFLCIRFTKRLLVSTLLIMVALWNRADHYYGRSMK